MTTDEDQRDAGAWRLLKAYTRPGVGALIKFGAGQCYSVTYDLPDMNTVRQRNFLYERLRVIVDLPDAPDVNFRSVAKVGLDIYAKMQLEPAAPIEQTKTLTNEELVAAIDSAYGKVRASSKGEDVNTKMLSHLTDLLAEQKRRATAVVCNMTKTLFEQECADGDKICDALGLKRTEGGRLPMYKILYAIAEALKVSAGGR